MTRARRLFAVALAFAVAVAVFSATRGDERAAAGPPAADAPSLRPDAGRARLAARSGDLDGAIARWRSLVARLPLPEYVIGLGEAELAAGRVRAGRADLALVPVQERLLADA